MAAMADLQGSAYATGDAIGQIMDVKYDNLTDAFAAIKRKGEVALLPMASTIAKAFTSLAPVIGDAFEEMGPIIEETTEAAMPFVTDFLEGTISTVREAMPMVQQFAGAILPLLATFISQLLPPLLSILEQILPLIIDIASTFLPALSTVLLTILPLLSELLSALLPVVEPLLRAIMAALKPVMDALGPLSELLGTIIGWIAKIVGWVGEGLTWVVDLVFGDVSGDVAKAAGVNGFAAGGFTSGPSLAGEDPNYPTEAVISFNPAYRSANLAYWAEAGRILGADNSDFSLSGEGGGDYYDMGGVNFAPEIHVHGHADKESIMEAIEEEYPEFLDLLDEWWRKKHPKGEPAYG